MDDIRNGTLTFAHRLQMPNWASIREFRLGRVWILTGIVVLLAALSQLGQYQFRTVGFLLTLILGSVMIYCFWLMVTSVLVYPRSRLPTCLKGCMQPDVGRWIFILVG
jgi:ABC-type uncharacterized transport system permease subunit